MKIHKLLFPLIIIIMGSGITILLYQKYKTPMPTLFKTEHPQRKTITQTVAASGILEIKNMMKIGSVISGIATKIYVEENEFVKKEQLLTYIDPGTGETDYQIALLNVQKSQQEFDYKKNNFERQKQLYEAKQLAKDAFQNIEKEYIKTELDLKIAKETLQKEELNLNNRKIKAIGDGYITTINVSQGMSVSGANVSAVQASLFEIAPDITQMEAKLDIDESDIGLIKPGQEIKITVNTYPDMHLLASIATVGFAPKSAQEGNGSKFYKATADINNKEKLLRPGMLLNAKINIAKAKKVLCVQGIVFNLNYKALALIAKKLGYSYKALPENFRYNLRQQREKRIKFLWVFENKSFIQKAVSIGTTDDNLFEIKAGITEKDTIVTDIIEEDKMEEMYKKWFGGAL